MMTIGCQNRTLSLDAGSSTLKLRHISQLKHWGFKKDKNGDFTLDSNVESTFLKVIDYLRKKELAFELDQSARDLQDRIMNKEVGYQRKFHSGRLIKDGDYSVSDFEKHLNFLTKNIPRKLKEHQLKASFHLWEVKNGANFSVPGSGKTTVVLSVYERLKKEQNVNVLFVVGPPACFGPWRSEFEAALGRKPEYKILAGGDKEDRKALYFSKTQGELLLTSFQTLMNDREEVLHFLRRTDVKPMMVVDEAHYMKQVNGNWANSLLELSQFCEYKCILTGTPIPRGYSDVYNLFDFLWPDNNPISTNYRVRLQIHEEEKNYEAASQLLENLIGPLFYRVRKKELNLEDQIFLPPEEVEMKEYEKKIYNAIVNKIRDYSKEDYLKNIEFVEKLRRGRMMRLRQTVSYIGLLENAIQDYSEDLIGDNSYLSSIIATYDQKEVPAKMERLLLLVKKYVGNGEKVVIWANFIGTIKLIEKNITQFGFQCKKIIGETPVERTALADEETRERIRNQFVDPDSGLNVLIANPAACSESISLHKTCYRAIYYDLSYNCAQYLQSLDRIHRVGGSENQESYYHFLQYKGTMEADIYDNLQSKKEKMYSVVEKDYNIYSMDMLNSGDEELDIYKKIFGIK